MIEWQTDISAAPRGEEVTLTRPVFGELKEVSTKHFQKVWLATRCGKVVLSYWIEPTKWTPHGRWTMLGAERPEQPIAWRPFVDGEFPFTFDPETKERLYPNGEAPAFPSRLPQSAGF